MPSERDKQNTKWRIKANHDHKLWVVAEIPCKHTSEGLITKLIQMLYAKLSLTDDEIVASHLRRGRRGHRDHFPVHKMQSQDDSYSLIVSEGSTFVSASIVRPESSNYDLEEVSSLEISSSPQL